MLIEHTFKVGPLACNCRLLICSETGHAVLIDPGDEADFLNNKIRELSSPARVIELKYLLHTHAHFDHIGATAGVSLEHKHAPIALHPADVPLYVGLQEQGKLFGFEFDEPLPVEMSLEQGQKIQFGKMHLQVLHTPGHSPGSVSFFIEDGNQQVVYTGDTLFRENIGRADLWGGDHHQLVESIQKKLFILNESTRVAPGHGLDSSILYEIKNNPYI